MGSDDGVAVVQVTRQALMDIGEAVADMAARVGQIAASAHELSGSAERLNELVAQFKVGT